MYYLKAFFTIVESLLNVSQIGQLRQLTKAPQCNNLTNNYTFQMAAKKSITTIKKYKHHL